MTSVMSTAANGLTAAAKGREVETGNLASMTVNAYKRQDPAFMELPYRTERRLGTSDGEVGIVQIGMGAAFTNNVGDMSQGGLKKTDNKFEIALDGQGFLIVTLPDGRTAYTRDGALSRNQDGNIVVAASGMLLNQAPITVPIQGYDSFNISPEGEVSYKDDVTNLKVVLDNIQLARFLNPSGLERFGSNLYLETDASGPPEFGDPAQDNFAIIKQGFLEKANVDPLQALLKVLELQRIENYIARVDESDANVHQSIMQYVT